MIVGVLGGRAIQGWGHACWDCEQGPRALRDPLPGRPLIWTWEIQRRPKELGIKLYGTDFKTECAAKLAGEKALMAFFDVLAKEERNA